jgi:hypothetical protein
VKVVPSVARLTSTGVTAAAVLFGAAACTGLDQASAAGISRDNLISEMAGQLAASAGLTYTAKYQLAGGDTARITQTQKPTRTAYAFPGGRLILTATATIRCTGDENAPDCVETTPSPANDARQTGALITPDVVLAMLNSAALDATVVAKQHDTTVAGRHATCLDLSRFTVCVTSEGALGSFTGVLGGRQADVALTAYSDKPDESAFALPPAASLTDKRQ